MPSILARDSVKDFLSCVIPAAVYRQFYFILSTIALGLLCYCWIPMPYLIWDFRWTPLHYISYCEHTRTHTYTHTHTLTHTHTHSPMHTHTHPNACTYTHSEMYMYDNRNVFFPGLFMLGGLMSTLGFFTWPLDFVGIQSPVYRLLNM